MSLRPLWPAMPPPCFSFATPGGEIELVVDHQDLFGLDLEEAGEHLHRPAARVHEALRQEQPGAALVLDAAPTSAWYFGSLRSATPLGRGEALDQPEARVVARALVLLARVAEADDETDQAGLLLLFFSPLSAPCAACRRLVAALAALACAPRLPSGAACAVVGTSAADTARRRGFLFLGRRAPG